MYAWPGLPACLLPGGLARRCTGLGSISHTSAASVIWQGGGWAGGRGKPLGGRHPELNGGGAGMNVPELVGLSSRNMAPVLSSGLFCNRL